MERVHAGPDSRGGRFSLCRHICALTPLFALAAGVYLLCGDEHSAARFFRHLGQATAGIRPAVVWLTKYGNIPFYLAFAHVGLRSLATRRRDGLAFVLGYVAFLLVLLMAADTLKIWIGRPRPGEPGEYVLFSLEKVRHSFPSNHIAETTFTALTLAHYFEDRRFTLFCSAWLAVMGFTRMYLGRHHPSDLLGSALLGSLIVYGLFWQLDRTDS